MSANDEYRTGRRGNDTVRGGSQRNTNNSRDGTPGSQPNRRGGKQVQQNVNRSQPQPQLQPQQLQQQQQQQSSAHPPQQQRGTPPPTQASQSRPQNGPTPQSEQHASLPVLNNAAELRDFLSSGVNTNIPVYKPEASSEAARSGNPWGSKPGMMGNNKDFWLELRRQMTALQKQQQATEPPARGG